MSQFIHIDTKEKVRIVSDEGNFLTLNNGTKIDKQLFAQKYAAIPDETTINANDFMNIKPNVIVNPKSKPTQVVNESVIAPTGSVDPIDFLNSTNIPVDGIENIQKIDTSKHLDIPDEEGRVTVRDLSQENSTIQQAVPSSLESQRQALLEKHKYQTQAGPGYIDENDPNAVDSLIKSYQKPEKVTVLNENGLTEHQERMRQQHMELKNGEDPYAEKIRKYRLSKGLSPEPIKNPQKPLIPQQSQQSQQSQQTQQSQQSQVQVEDPTTALFKRFKRNSKITINLKIKDKISKPDFIKVMAEGLEGDIIQYYTDEIMKTFMQDYEQTKQNIYDQIHLKVYGCLPSDLDDGDDDVDDDNDVILPKKKRKKRIIPNVPKSERSQMSEGVKEKTVTLIPGKPTKTGKLRFKYINKSGNVVDVVAETAEKKGYKPATKKDLKK